MSKTLDQAYSRYEDYLSKRKQVDTDSEQYVREQRYLSEQVTPTPTPTPTLTLTLTLARFFSASASPSSLLPRACAAQP